MRCWVVVPAVTLLFLASVGKGDAVKLQGRKIDAGVEKKSSAEEHRSVEATATSNSGEVPDRPAAEAAPAAVESSAAEADPVGVSSKLNLHMTEARLVSEVLKVVLPSEISIPFLPAINFMGLSMCLTKVRILGLDKFVVRPTDFLGPEKAGQVEFNKLTLLADPYIAGGRLHNLTFVGEGAFNATVLRLRINVKFHRLEGTTFCPTPNSTVFTISLQQLIVKFENLNPGFDTGELINTMLSGYGNDMMALLSLACNNENLLHPLADKIAVAIISRSCFYASDAFDSDGGNRKTKEFSSSQSSKSCNENYEKEEDSSKEARGGNVTDLQGLKNLEKSVNEMIRTLTASLADPLAEILEKSLKF